MPALLADYPPDVVASITGSPRTTCARRRALIGGTANLVTLLDDGPQPEHPRHVEHERDLQPAPGDRDDRPAGSGPLSLTGQPNAMGGREMGYMGPGLPGQRSALVDADRRFVEDVWGVAPGTIRAEGGTGTIDLFGGWPPATSRRAG